MALIGYEVERQKIVDKIGQIKAQLGGKGAPAAGAKKAGRSKRVLSAAARARISAAQKKRWAEHRKSQAAKK
jgi:chorismate mutase